MKTKHSTTNPPLPAMKSSADSPPATTRTKRNEELELLKKILIEAKHFRLSVSDNGQPPAKVKRKGVAGVGNGDKRRRRGTV
jgi:hypothetical protein